MNTGYMISYLNDALALLPSLLGNVEVWDSIIINRRKPYTYRIFTTLENGLRLCLHEFDPCNIDESVLHPHPWPGAFMILDGSYLMNVGYSCLGRLDTSPVEVATFVLEKYSSYEMINPNTWHSVTPLKTTYTVMVNGHPWDTESQAHTSVRTTKGKNLEKMEEYDLVDNLSLFKSLVHQYYSHVRQNNNDRIL